MTTLSYRTKTELYKSAVEAELDVLLSNRDDIPSNLLSAMRYSLLGGGKRLRACLVFGAWELFGGDFNSHEEQRAVLPLACALECIHAYSLIHDDLPCMDDDDFRRGKPSNHKVYGEALALLAGDGLLSFAFELILDAVSKHFKQFPGYVRSAREIISGAGCSGMICGQVLDMQSEEQGGDIELLRRIHAGKTGALIRAAVLAGAYAGTRTPIAHEAEAISEFADAYGLLFQITDDILDVTGDFAALGKTTGKDAKSNKLTYPNLLGMEASRKAADDTAKRALDAIACFGESGDFFAELVKATVNRDR